MIQIKYLSCRSNKVQSSTWIGSSTCTSSLFNNILSSTYQSICISLFSLWVWQNDFKTIYITQSLRSSFACFILAPEFSTTLFLYFNSYAGYSQDSIYPMVITCYMCCKFYGIQGTFVSAFETCGSTLAAKRKKKLLNQTCRKRYRRSENTFCFADINTNDVFFFSHKNALLNSLSYAPSNNP